MATSPPTIPNLVRQAAAASGERDYLVTPDERLSFAGLERRSRRLGRRLLDAGVAKGTHVGVLFPQGPDFVVALVAVARIGAVAVPLSTFLRGDELRRAIDHTDIHLLLAPADLLGRRLGDELEGIWPEVRSASAHALAFESAPSLRRVWLVGGDQAWASRLDGPLGEGETPADPMVIVLTSGSTAAPKAVVHSHGAQVRQARKLAAVYELRPDVRTFTTMPFFWVGGLTVTLLTHLHAGACVLTVPRTDGAQMLDLIERDRPTRLVGWRLVERLRADPSFPDRDLRWLPALAVDPVDASTRHGALGMTETCGPHTGVPVSRNEDPLPDHLRGSFGRPLPGMEHKIVDPDSGGEVVDGVEGELCVRGDCLMLGIHGVERQHVFDADGWYHTGDRGSFRDGFLFFTGRLTDMIKAGGANVAPREVELALEGQPGVRAAFVVGVDDAVREQVVGCVLCPEDGVELDVDQVLGQLSQHLSPYKLPRKVVVLPYDDVPLLASGKVDKPAVGALLTAGRTPT